MKKLLTMIMVITMLVCTAGCSGSNAGVNADDGKVTIALIDSGVSTAAIRSEYLMPGYNYVLGSEDTEDQINHGTAVASIILGCESADVEAMTQEVCVVPLVSVTKQDGELTSVSPETLAGIIREAIDNYKADIINISLGIREDNDALREAAEYAESKGVLIVSAVGNDGEDGRPYYPASYETVLAVGSCNKHGEQSQFSQEGADVLAPGESIMLASRNGVPYGIRGTSFATGYVSAYAANLLAENPEMEAERLRNQVAGQGVIF